MKCVSIHLCSALCPWRWAATDMP